MNNITKDLLIFALFFLVKPAIAITEVKILHSPYLTVQANVLAEKLSVKSVKIDYVDYTIEWKRVRYFTRKKRVCGLLTRQAVKQESKKKYIVFNNPVVVRTWVPINGEVTRETSWQATMVELDKHLE